MLGGAEKERHQCAGEGQGSARDCTSGSVSFLPTGFVPSSVDLLKWAPGKCTSYETGNTR